MEHELGGPDVASYADAVEHLDGPSTGSDDLPGGLYDDAAVVTEDLGDDPVWAELDIDGSLLDTIEGELADVERALALLDEGTYGQCEHCNRAIDDDVLARTPTARFCAEHLPLSPR